MEILLTILKEQRFPIVDYEENQITEPSAQMTSFPN